MKKQDAGRFGGYTDIKRYFEEVIKMERTGEAFPVNLDEVWPLVYANKENAVHALRETGVENVDYQRLVRDHESKKRGKIGGDNKENAVRALCETGIECIDYQRLVINDESKKKGKIGGDFRSMDYRISVSCMEWLIARRNRAVFNVYRLVFHLAMNTGQSVTTDGFTGYVYMDVLRGLGMSVRSGSFWRRIRRYPQEFHCTHGMWMITAAMANVLRDQVRLRATYRALLEGRERYLSETSLNELRNR